MILYVGQWNNFNIILALFKNDLWLSKAITNAQNEICHNLVFSTRISLHNFNKLALYILVVMHVSILSCDYITFYLKPG